MAMFSTHSGGTMKPCSLLLLLSLRAALKLMVADSLTMGFSPPADVRLRFGPAYPRIDPGIRRTCLQNRNLCSRRLLATGDHGNGGTEQQKDPVQEDDDVLLKDVELSELRALCRRYNLPTSGTKQNLLFRLRQFSSQEASKTDEAVFYYSSPEKTSPEKKTEKAKRKENAEDGKSIHQGLDVANPFSTLPTRVNEKGEKVVTVYSSSDANDLTGYGSHSKPGQGFAALSSALGGEISSGGSTADALSNSRSSQASQKEADSAREVCEELIGVLLSETGAPGFNEYYGQGLTPLENGVSEHDGFANGDSDLPQKSSSGTNNVDNGNFRGFNPKSVSAEVLSECSKSLRAGNGQALHEAIREYEIQAVGHDGMAGDDASKGGGHYREVQKVSVFLDGFRQAEVRRISRSTITMLLNAIADEGAQGLDRMLASMTRGDGEGELNDALVEYLNDSIRSQNKKVEQEQAQQKKPDVLLAGENRKVDDDLGDIHNILDPGEVSNGGVITETLDLNDAKIRELFSTDDEFDTATYGSPSLSLFGNKPRDKMSGSEQLLLLLKLLRERLKAEAAFQGDERGRNLRLLAYCMYAQSDAERESIILSEVGGSLDRMDSFGDLLASSVAYAESTSHQMMPSRRSPLNVALLKHIQKQLSIIQQRQTLIASSGTARPDALP